MKKIIIFTSGNGKAAERIVSIFNGGDRIHTELVFTDITDEDFGRSFAESGVRKIFFNEEIWTNSAPRIMELIETVSPDLIVTDGWNTPLPQQIVSAVEDKIVSVDSPEEAPLQVVKALEKADEEQVPPIPEPEEKEKTPDEEWAESLQVNFVPPTPEDTPPPIPEEIEVEDIEPLDGRSESTQYGYYGNPPYNDYNRGSHGCPYQHREHHEHHYRNQEREPMPPTYLIWSVLTTIFCCFIPGIIAIIFSSQVSTKYISGDIEGAKRASRTAEIWIIVSFVFGVLTATLWFPWLLIN